MYPHTQESKIFWYFSVINLKPLERKEEGKKIDPRRLRNKYFHKALNIFMEIRDYVWRNRSCTKALLYVVGILNTFILAQNTHTREICKRLSPWARHKSHWGIIPIMVQSMVSWGKTGKTKKGTNILYISCTLQPTKKKILKLKNTRSQTLNVTLKIHRKLLKDHWEINEDAWFWSTGDRYVLLHFKF